MTFHVKSKDFNMKIVRKQKKKSKKKQRLEQPKKQYKRWKIRSKKYSDYPYIITVSFFRRNVFLTASDLQGRIKVWTNAGRWGFKGRNKKEYMAIVTVAENFFRKVANFGIRFVFLKFKNFRNPRAAIKKAIRKHKRKKNSRLRLKYLGIWTELHVSFNGCRRKKLRRKRFRRRPRHIRLK